tara:strand:- start:17 stop:862 length:846 start_codon:yes stop_codon:yes gene_type:complete
MPLKLDDIKLSNKKISILNKKPFPFFCWDNFLPTDVYKELEACWPDDSYFKSSIYGGKQSIQKNQSDLVEKFFDKNQIWRDLLCLFDSQQFIDDAKQFIKPLQFPHRPIISMKKWKLNKQKNLSNFFTTNEVEIDWELSRYNKNNFLSPHTDRLTKYISLLLYFPDRKWNQGYGGGTVMYESKEKKYERNWGNVYIPLEYMNKVKTFEYIENRMVGFIKTANSWHGVEPINQPSNIYRKALAINISLSEKSKMSFSNRAKESFVRRISYNRFKNIDVHKKN